MGKIWSSGKRSGLDAETVDVVEATDEIEGKSGQIQASRKHQYLLDGFERWTHKGNWKWTSRGVGKEGVQTVTKGTKGGGVSKSRRLSVRSNFTGGSSNTKIGKYQFL